MSPISVQTKDRMLIPDSAGSKHSKRRAKEK